MSQRLRVSRTIVRMALRNLQDTGVVRLNGRDKTLLRAPRLDDRIAEPDGYISRDALESRFLDWILRFDVPAGTPLNVAQLAKRFTVAPHSLQEFLAGLSQFGLVERRSRGGWRLLGFTAEYAVELSEFRALLELNAVRALARLPRRSSRSGPRSTRWRRAIARCWRAIETDFHAFSPLDEAFHATINGVVRNRFVERFQRVISLIFHYHYQWDKRRERFRNEAAIGEHLAIVEALRSGDAEAAAAAAAAHLATAQETLLASLRSNRLV